MESIKLLLQDKSLITRMISRPVDSKRFGVTSPIQMLANDVSTLKDERARPFYVHDDIFGFLCSVDAEISSFIARLRIGVILLRFPVSRAKCREALAYRL